MTTGHQPRSRDPITGHTQRPFPPCSPRALSVVVHRCEPPTRAPSMTARFLQHSGELALRAQLGVPAAASESMASWPSPVMPQQHSDFFAALPYLAVACLDAADRPWASLLVADDESALATPLADDCLVVKAPRRAWTPWCAASARAASRNPASAGPCNSPGLPQSLPAYTHARRTELMTTSKRPSQPFALLGVDFTNRRRNKLAGALRAADVRATDAHVLARLSTNESMGNCPKYITVRRAAFRRGARHRRDGVDRVSRHAPLCRPRQGRRLVRRQRRHSPHHEPPKLQRPPSRTSRA